MRGMCPVMLVMVLIQISTTARAYFQECLLQGEGRRENNWHNLFSSQIFSFFRKYDGTAGFAKKLLKNQYCTSAPRITSEIPQLLPKTTKCFGQMQNLWKLKSELVIGVAKVISLSLKLAITISMKLQSLLNFKINCRLLPLIIVFQSCSTHKVQELQRNRKTVNSF